MAPALLLAAVSPAAGESAGAYFAVDAWPPPTPPARPGQFLELTGPMRLAEATALPPFAALAPARSGARDEIDALRLWNLGGRSPLKNGFSRPLPEPLAVRVALGPGAAVHAPRLEGAAATAAGPGWFRWAARVRVEDAYRLRLHLARVRLPPAAELWVYGSGGGPAIAFGRELVAPEGDLWTPSVAGPVITLELMLPAGTPQGGATGAAFALDKLLEIVRPPVTPSSDRACLIDGSCVGNDTFGIIASYRHAVGELFFVIDGNGFACSGGLLNDKLNSGTPYLLTANHCISTQAAASTLQVFWDYTTSPCNGAAPPFDSLPQSHGATLLATSLKSDFAFMKLTSVPPGRFFLGWTTAAVANGTVMSRLSHPCPDCPGSRPLAEAYSTTLRTTSPANVCGVDGDGRDWGNLADFLYSAPQKGATFPGSSGAPALDPGGLVVGQLLGACGTSFGIHFPCSFPTFYNVVDGAFAVTYPAIGQWLNPDGAGGACAPDALTLCIDDQPGDQRFKVRASFHSGQGLAGSGHAVALGSLGVGRGGLFWFFNADNPEVLVKVLNGCALDGHYWVFLSAGTNVGLSVTVTDTQAGHSWTRTNADGTAMPSIQDTSALPCS